MAFFALMTVTAFLVWFAWVLQKCVSNCFFHPLSRFPGPKLAACSTYWKAFMECVLDRSFCHELQHLHRVYGDVVRVGPNELHFGTPQAYHDIYNNQNRWDKEYTLYHSFGEDRSSFGFLTYKEAKERKDVLNRMFSAQAIAQAQGLVLDKVNALCLAFDRLSKARKPADLSWAFRCMSMDIITYLCFGKSVDAINEPDFKAPIIVAMDASLPVFVRFKHSEMYKNMIMNCPPNLSKILSPATAGLVDLQQILSKQISELSESPEKLDHLPHKMTIFHQLMNKEAWKNGTVPVPGSLYEESQALMFGGGDTTGNALMLTTYYVAKQPETYMKLKQELRSAWPVLDRVPSLKSLEQLPYLNAVIKEGLRMSTGVVSGLARVVPLSGAKICDTFVPAGTIVSCGSTFVHFNGNVFVNPNEFRPERWLEKPDLDNWLVSFSRGPRSCLGINLAWMELRMAFAHVFRKFDIELESSSPTQLTFIERFLPLFEGTHVKANMTAVSS